MTEAIDESTGEVVVHEAQHGLARYEGTGGLEAARQVAVELDGFIRERNLAITIGKGEHIRVEAWCALGTMMGVAPRTAWTKDVEVQGQTGFEARVEVVKIATGEVVGAAEAGCFSGETQSRWVDNVKQIVPRWDDLHAMMSMAQTRATSKALGQVLRWIPELAGYSGTPAEEMPPVAAEPGPTSGVEYSAAQKQAQTEVFDAPAKEDKAALAREVLGAQDVDTSPVKPPVEQRRSSAKAISLPQAGRAIAIAIDAGKKYDEKGFRVLQSVLKAHGLESIPHGSDGAAAKQHLTEQLEWGQQYDAFCGALEVWSPKEVSAEDF